MTVLHTCATDLIGRTVAQAYYGRDELCLSFTDGTHALLMAFGDTHYLGLCSMDAAVDQGHLNVLVDAGVITYAEEDALYNRRREENKKVREREERATLDRLIDRYGVPSGS